MRLVLSPAPCFFVVIGLLSLRGTSRGYFHVRLKKYFTCVGVILHSSLGGRLLRTARPRPFYRAVSSLICSSSNAARRAAACDLSLTYSGFGFVVEIALQS